MTMLGTWKLNSVNCTDLFALCDGLPDASVDMILCDLPYAVTQNGWDELIPFAPMWTAFKRVIKPRGAIVLTASQPFTSALVMSNPSMFRYEWIWNKSQGSGFLDANRKPLKAHESVLVFAEERPVYYPQMTFGQPYISKRRNALTNSKNYGKFGLVDTISNGERFPVSSLYFPNERTEHPTQKPVELFSYLIRTYTQPGELVLDPCVGSGTTAIAAREEGRQFICGDSSAEYVAIAQKRLDAPYTPNMFAALETVDVCAD